MTLLPLEFKKNYLVRYENTNEIKYVLENAQIVRKACQPAMKLILMLLGNLIYLMCGVTSYSPKVIMFIARAVAGLGAAIQIAFTPLGYPGINLIGDLNFDMYTAPAFLGLAISIVCAFLIVFFFHDSNVGLQKVVVKNEKYARFFALPKYDRRAIMTCIFTQFVQLLLVQNMETLGAPISMTIFLWNKKQTVQYNSLIHGGFGFIGIFIYAITIYFDIGELVDHRISTCGGMLALVVYHLLTFPWWFLPGSIPYQEEYECKTTPPMNPVLFIITSLIIIGPVYSLVTVTMNTTFSTLLGPRNQGTMQGILIFAGNVAKMGGAIAMAHMFTHFGPRPVWSMQILFAGFCAFLWIYFYKRMVPLKMLQNLSAGDVVKNKYGFVYKF